MKMHPTNDQWGQDFTHTYCGIAAHEMKTKPMYKKICFAFIQVTLHIVQFLLGSQRGKAALACGLTKLPPELSALGQLAKAPFALLFHLLGICCGLKCHKRGSEQLNEPQKDELHFSILLINNHEKCRSVERVLSRTTFYRAFLNHIKKCQTQLPQQGFIWIHTGEEQRQIAIDQIPPCLHSLNIKAISPRCPTTS